MHMEEKNPGRRMGLWRRTVGAAGAFGLVAMLSACGGGGGDKAPTTGGQLPVVDPSATDQSVFALNRTYQSIDGVNTEALQVVNTRTGTVALTVDGQASGSAYVESTVTSRYAVNSANIVSYLGNSQLFTVEGRQLKQRDLRGTSVGPAQTVSPLNTVCTAFVAHPLNKDGDQGWVEVLTGATPADCNTSIGIGSGGTTSTTTPSTETRLVPFGVAGADTSVLAGSTGLTWVSGLYNKLDEPAVGILAIDRKTATLNVYSTNLKSRLSNVVLPAPLVATDTASIEGTLPTNPTRSLLRIGAKLYLSTITGTQVSLGPLVRTLKSAASFDAISDGQNLYFADGNTLVQASATGEVKTLPTPALGTGRLGNLTASGGSLLFTQANSTTRTTSVWAYALATGKLTNLDTGLDGFDHRILRAEGDTVWLENLDPSTRRSDITKMKVDGTQVEGVQSGLQLVGVVTPASFTPNSAPQASAVLWCEAPEGATGCLNLWQTDVVSGASVNLGTVPIDAGWRWDSLYVGGDATDDRPGLVSLGQFQPPLPGSFVSNQKLTTLWFTPGIEKSLKAVKP
jgi:hypothetical protein